MYSGLLHSPSFIWPTWTEAAAGFIRTSNLLGFFILSFLCFMCRPCSVLMLCVCDTITLGRRIRDSFRVLNRPQIPFTQNVNDYFCFQRFVVLRYQTFPMAGSTVTLFQETFSRQAQCVVSRANPGTSSEDTTKRNALAMAPGATTFLYASVRAIDLWQASFPQLHQ